MVMRKLYRNISLSFEIILNSSIKTGLELKTPE